MSFNKGNTCVIGIGGATCGGKTTLTSRLKNSFPNSRVINMDDYYYEEDSSHHVMLREFNFTHANWELPSSIHIEQMMNSINSALKEMVAVPRPNILFIEGIIIHAFKDITQLLDKKFFITLDRDECKKRRLLRHYEPPDPEGYFDLIAWPAYLEHLSAIREQNDLVFLSGESSPDTLFTKALKEINQALSDHA